MLPTEGGEHFFQKMHKIRNQGVCTARLAQRKFHMAQKIHKTACVLHTNGFADGAAEAKNAQVTTGKQIFDGRLKRSKHKLSK